MEAHGVQEQLCREPTVQKTCFQLHLHCGQLWVIFNASELVCWPSFVLFTISHGLCLTSSCHALTNICYALHYNLNNKRGPEYINLAVQKRRPLKAFSGFLKVPELIFQYFADYLSMLWAAEFSLTGDSTNLICFSIIPYIISIRVADNLLPCRYLFNWYFQQDGTIEYEIKLTGELSTNQLSQGEGSNPEYGTLVMAGVNAQHHQHMFCARLDMAVDDSYGGAGLVVSEVRAFWICIKSHCIHQVWSALLSQSIRLYLCSVCSSSPPVIESEYCRQWIDWFTIFSLLCACHQFSCNIREELFFALRPYSAEWYRYISNSATAPPL